MKVAFVGGGTGGHLAPGIGVAEVLEQQGHSALFLVAGRPIEEAMLSVRGLSSEPLFEAGERPSLHRFSDWWRAGRRLSAAVRRYDPDVIVVLGGWVALPTLWSGILGRPSVLIESNAAPGKVQRLLGGRVDHACLAFAGERMPRGRLGTHLTGSPVPRLAASDRGAAEAFFGLDPQRSTLLLTGGSQGAADLNALLEPARAVLAADGRRWQVLHVSGPGSDAGQAPAPRTEQASALDQDQDRDVPVVRCAFVSDMGAAWSVADVAICRAGAGTVAELAATGTPAVLVPYPHHADRHQEANGRGLVEAGAAVMVPANDPRGLTAPALLANCLGRLPAMACAAASQARPDAAQAVAAVVSAAAAPGSRS